MTAARILAVLGAAFELVGFSWVIADAAAALSHEYGEHGPFRRVWYWLRFWLGPPPEPVSLSGTASGSLGMRGRLTARKEPESDVERLERELGTLRQDLEDYKETTDRRLSGVEERLSEAMRQFAERADRIEQRLLDLRHRTLRRERWGARVFMFGIVLTLISALV
jgi:hypothetical protein